MRTKKSFLNLLSDIIPQLVLVILSFIRVKYFLQNLGPEILGAYQLFTQILAYLALAELGLTSAVMYTLYKPISEKNYEKISSIVVGAKKTFNFILLLMLILGLGISPFVKNFISGTTLSNIFLMTAFILTLIANVFTYFSTAYTIMFDSNQEKYKYNFFTQAINIIKQVTQIILIILYKNIYIILLVEIIFVLLKNLLIKILFKKNYSYVNMKIEKDTSFWSKTKSLIPHKIGILISNNIDILIVSKFINLTAVVIYTSYYYITSTIGRIVGTISSSTLSSIGNLIIEDKKRVYNVFLEYNSMLFYIATIICLPLALVITPFVKIWYGSQYTVNNLTMYLFIFILFYGIIRIVLNTFTNAAGLFKETLLCPFIEIIINLVVSLLLVKEYGIAGLLIGTSLSLIISEFIIKPFILNKYVFKSNIFLYYKDSILNFTIFILEFLLLKNVLKIVKIDNISVWFIISAALFIVGTILTTIIYKLLNKLTFFKRLKNLKGE